MTTFFGPAIGLLNRTGFKFKFIIIFLCVQVPLMVLGYLMLNAIEQDMQMLENEIDGVSYVQAIRQPIDNIQQHRGLVTTLTAGDISAREARTQTLRARIGSDLNDLRDLSLTLGASQPMTARVSAIQGQWQTIRDQRDTMSVDASFDAHNQLVDELISLGEEASDYFQISLSASLETYYLGDALVNRLPALTEALGQARALATPAAANGLLEGRERIRLEIALHNINTFGEAMARGLESAIDADPSLQQSLSRPLQEALTSARQTSQLIREQILDAVLISVDQQSVFDAASQAMAQSYRLYDAIAPQLDRVLNAKLADANGMRTTDILIVLGILVVLSYMFSSLYFAINDSVAKIREAAIDITNGNLSRRVTVDAKDEMASVAEHVNSIAAQFEHVIQTVGNASTQLAAAAEELSSVSRHSADNVQQQRSETDMIAVSINEMNATVLEVSRNTSQASEAASNTDREAVSGAAVAHSAAQSIAALAEDIHNSAGGMQRVAADSQAISSVLDVIMGVAEQTNLLALNAAIEAARAGEFGRGFAVVADEVRTLANRTKDSASEIESMIHHLQSGVSNAVGLMEKSRQRASEGVAKANEAAQALDAITHAVNTISDMTMQIASATEQQSATTDELNRNVTSIRELAEQSAAGASQTTSASDELARLASSLQQSVSSFTVSECSARSA